MGRTAFPTCAAFIVIALWACAPASAQRARVCEELPRNSASFHSDHLNLGPGDDVITGLRGRDVIYGGPGDDVITGARDNDRIYGGPGNDIICGGSADDLLRGGPGNDRLYGEEHNDVLDPGPGNDYALGSAGDDRVYGWGRKGGSYVADGEDTIDGGYENDVVEGGGVDVILGGSHDDTLRTRTPGITPARFNANNQNDIVYGSFGNDYIQAKLGDDILYGGPGNDRIRGGGNEDRLYGQEGNDVLFGETGVDRLFGQAGNDVLNGGPLADLLTGGDGIDSCFGNLGTDRVMGDCEARDAQHKLDHDVTIRLTEKWAEKRCDKVDRCVRSAGRYCYPVSDHIRRCTAQVVRRRPDGALSTCETMLFWELQKGSTAVKLKRVGKTRCD